LQGREEKRLTAAGCRTRDRSEAPKTKINVCQRKVLTCTVAPADKADREKNEAKSKVFRYLYYASNLAEHVIRGFR